MLDAIKALLAILTALFITSCTQQKTISPEELRSAVTQAISLASESDMLIDSVLQKRVTRSYARGHIEYLLDAVARTRQDLNASSPELSNKEHLCKSRQQLDLLVKVLTEAQSELDNAESLQAAKRPLTRVEEVLRNIRGAL